MTNDWLMLLAGIAMGGVVGWLITRNSAAQSEAAAASLRQQLEKLLQETDGLRARLEAEVKARAGAEASLDATRKNLDEQRHLLDDARQKLSEAFKSLSSDVLMSQSESFLKLAGETFGKLRAQTDGDLGKRQEAIDVLVQPLKEALLRYEGEIKAIEANRQDAYGSLRQHLTQIGDTQNQLQRETANLVTALRKPQVRGRWGEITLRRLAELSGMVDRCDFFEQQTVSSADEATIRPDMVVHLPGDREIIVDSKVALDAYLDSIEAKSEEEKQQFLVRHAAQVRRHMEQLGSKAYWDRLPKAPEFAVLFLPGDPFLGAAVERDPVLIEDGMAHRVVIATPSTLIALLLAVYHGWRPEQLHKNAEEISDRGKQLYKRVHTMWEHLDSLRSAIDKTVESWNRVVGSLEHQVLPSVRRFRDLKATTADEIPELEQVEKTTRALPSSPEKDSE